MGFGQPVRNSSKDPGNREDRRDEDEDLEGAGSLERGQPSSRFFETLEYRVTNPEGGLPEVPGRRPNGGISGACANTPSRLRSRGRREGRRRRAHGEGDDRRGQDREGESPREEETQESQDDGIPQRCGADIPTRQGEETPAARPRRTRRPDRGGDHRRAVDDPGRTGFHQGYPTTTASGAEAERRRGRVGPGETRTAERQ